MFKLLKDKLKKTISSFTRKIEEEGKEVISEDVVKEKVIEEPITKKVEEKPRKLDEDKEVVKKEGFFKKLKDRFIKEDYDFPDSEAEVIEDKKHEKKSEEVKEGIGKKEVSEPKIPVERKDQLYQKIGEIKEEIREVKETEELDKVKIKKEIGEIKEEVLKEEKESKDQVKKGFFSKIKEKISTKKIDSEQFEKMFWDLEVGLLENNIAVEVIDKIKNDLKIKLVEKPILRVRIEETIRKSLRDSIDELFVDKFDIMDKIKEKKPFVICFVGINGSGKTTTIAKIASMLRKNKKSVVIAAADTFRAAAISQLQEHADRLGVKLIKQDYGSDPAAVAYDAIAHAKSKGIDVVLIDTAGRIHSNQNLIDEMKKIVRIAKPGLKIFVGESITGNDCVEQAKQFNEAIDIDGIILAKSDVDEKGGAAISVSYVTKKPILYLGTGQGYDDLELFDPKIINEGLGLA